MIDEIQPLGQPVELAKEEIQKAGSYAARINNVQNRINRYGYIVVLIVENMILLKQLNEARHALGLDPLPVVDNSKAKIA